jgi:hypothetical protein
MTIRAVAAALLTLAIATASHAQESTSLTRSEVAALKAKLVAVQQAMGGDPSGYTKEEEDSFYLPTDFNPAQDGKFWPITSSVQMQYTDEGAVNSAAAMEKFQADFQTRYVAAIASGNAEVIEKLLAEMAQMQNAALSAAMTPAAKKQDMRVDVQINMNPIVAIDPDAVVLEQRGVIALRDKDDAAGTSGTVTVYLDPVALAAVEDRASNRRRRRHEPNRRVPHRDQPERCARGHRVLGSGLRLSRDAEGLRSAVASIPTAVSDCHRLLRDGRERAGEAGT